MPIEPAKVGGLTVPTPPPPQGGADQTSRTKGGRPIDGAPVAFFKEAGRKITDAFKALGQGISNLAPKHSPTSDKLSKEAKAAFADHRAAAAEVERLEKAGNLTDVQKTELKQAKADLATARKEAVKHLKQEFFASKLYQRAQDEPDKGIFNNPPKFVSTDPAESLHDAAIMILGSPSKIDTILKKGLTIEQAVSMYIYTQGAYSGINKELRGGAPGEFIQRLEKSVTTGLEKLPPFTGPLYRIVSLPDTVDKNYQEGATVSDKAILSSTFNVDFDLFGGGTSHVLTIVGSEKSAGRDVSWLSESAHEKEVIFPPGTQFKVIQRDQAEMPQVIKTQPDGTQVFDSQVGLLLVQK